MWTQKAPNPRQGSQTRHAPLSCHACISISSSQHPITSFNPIPSSNLKLKSTTLLSSQVTRERWPHSETLPNSIKPFWTFSLRGSVCSPVNYPLYLYRGIYIIRVPFLCVFRFCLLCCWFFVCFLLKWNCCFGRVI